MRRGRARPRPGGRCRIQALNVPLHNFSSSFAGGERGARGGATGAEEGTASALAAGTLPLQLAAASMQARGGVFVLLLIYVLFLISFICVGVCCACSVRPERRRPPPLCGCAHTERLS